MSEKKNQLSYESVFIARQPVFKKNMDIWGYELLFRNHLDEQTANFSDENIATSKVILDGFSLAQKDISSKAKILINFPKKAILEETPYVLPPEKSVVEILENITPDREILKKCLKLKKKGYTLALDDYRGQKELRPLLKVIDIVKIDVLGLSHGDLEEVIDSIQDFPCKRLAEKVESREMFNLTKELGCDLFQGFFFSKPEIIPGRSIPSNQVAKLNILQSLEEMQQDNFDPAKLSQIVQQDVSLSYRLLKYINSPAIGLNNKIDSVLHAINLLGYQKIVKWLRVLVLAELNNSSRGQELSSRAAQRGYFLQLLAEAYDAPFSPNSMFLLGLFSLLDAILDQPMEKVLSDLPLEEEIAATLCGEETRGKTWLHLIQAQEQANWDWLDELIHELELMPEFTAACYVKALTWSGKMFGLAA